MIRSSEEVFGCGCIFCVRRSRSMSRYREWEFATRGLAVKTLICAVLAIVLILAGTGPADAWGARGFHSSTIVVSSRTVVVAPRTVVVARPHAGSAVIVSFRAVVVAPRAVVVARPHVFVGPRVFVGVGVGAPVWWPAYAYPYPAYAYAPPTDYAQPYGRQEPAYWYYCQNPAGYYPYVQQCPTSWLQVVP